MPLADANGIEIAYDAFGDAADPAVLLVSGLGAQLTGWDEGFCALLVARGFHVVRFDNRDVGQSTWIHTPDLDVSAAVATVMGGDPSPAPYRLHDMALDAIGLLDHLHIDRAHVVGASMGGMIAQTLAIEHPDRVLTLTSVMSTTGEPTVGAPAPDLLPLFTRRRPERREESIAFSVDTARVIGSPEHFDEARATARATVEYERGINPPGVARQFMAVVVSGSRAEGLACLDLPALVVHGRHDRLVDFSGGQRTAELVAGSEFLALDMAHEMPIGHWPRMADAIASVAARAA